MSKGCGLFHQARPPDSQCFVPQEKGPQSCSNRGFWFVDPPGRSVQAMKAKAGQDTSTPAGGYSFPVASQLGAGSHYQVLGP